MLCVFLSFVKDQPPCLREVPIRRWAFGVLPKALCAFCVYVAFFWSITSNLAFFWLSMETSRLCMTSCLECVVWCQWIASTIKGKVALDCHGMHIIRSGTQNLVVTHNNVRHYFLVTFLSEFVACVHSKGLRELQKYMYPQDVPYNSMHNFYPDSKLETFACLEYCLLFELS